MSWKTANLLNRLLPVVLFSSLISLLFEPWFRLYYPPERGPTDLTFYLWIIVMETVFILLAGQMAGFDDRQKRVWLLLGVMTGNLLIILIAGWPVAFFLTYSLILMIPALRFNSYYVNRDFEREFILGIFLYLLNLLVFEIPFSNLLLFFFGLISLAVIFNIQKMRSRGYPGKIKKSLLIVLIFTLAVYLISITFAVSINEAIYQGVLGIFNWLYLRFAELIILLIKPLVWLLTPLIRLFMFFLISLFNKDLKSQNNPIPRQDNSLPFTPPENPADIGVFFTIIFYVLLIGVIIFLVYRLKKGSEAEEEKGYLEERESLFSSQLLFQDMEGFFRGIISHFSRQGKSSYDRSNPLMIIREIYHDFLVEYRYILPYQSYYTPNQYLRDLIKEPEVDGLKDELQELTLLYNRARYGEMISKEDLKRAGELRERIARG